MSKIMAMRCSLSNYIKASPPDRPPFHNSINSQLLLQLLFAVAAVFSSVSCQFDQTQRFPAPAHYQIQQSHQHHQHLPTARPHELKEYQSLNPDFRHKIAEFDLEKFNRQTKELQEQIQLFNHHQQKHIQAQINNIQHGQSVQQFNYANGSLSELEKTGEHFVNLGHSPEAQRIPDKVIKITKTVAVKQPASAPYPASPSSLGVVKEQHFEYPHHGRHQTQHGNSHISTTVSPLALKKPASHFKYENKPINDAKAEKAESYQHIRHNGLLAYQEFDTEPFYFRTPKETIKFVPVPYYVDEHGNKHEIATSHSSAASTPASAHEQSQQTSASHATAHQAAIEASDDSERQSSSASSDSTGKFGAFTFSYKPPTVNIQPQHQPQHLSTPYALQQVHNLPEMKYFYNHNTGSEAESLTAQQYATEEHHDESPEHQAFAYKYVTYEWWSWLTSISEYHETFINLWFHCISTRIHFILLMTDNKLCA